MLEEFYLSFTGHGEVDLSQRNGEGEPYRSERLVHKITEAARLSMSWDEEEDEEDPAAGRVRLFMSQHHIEDDESGRAYHVTMTIFLNLDELKRVRNMINLLLEK